MPRDLARTLTLYAKASATADVTLLRELCRKDLFFLLTVVCRRSDMRHQWVLDRVDEVQRQPDGYLDLWAREHYKSSIITFGKTLQDILLDPEVTVGIFSHTRPIAKGFLRPLKRELEQNVLLRELFPDIIWQNPDKDAPTWSEDSGIIVKRSKNRKEASIEAWGLVEGMPTGKHFEVMVMDDIVTRDNAGSPEMREKTLDAWSHALNLGTRGGRRRMVGTRYHFGDAYGAMLERDAAIPRIYPAEVDGEPVLLTREEIEERRRSLGGWVFASQYMLDPTHDTSGGFKLEWLRQYDGEADGNTYVVVDPANSKRKKSDYTAAWVMTAGRDGNWYVRWFTRDRIGLAERIDLVMWMHREYRPLRVGYEQYGMQADIEAILMEQGRQKYRFDIAPLSGQLAKYDRIQKLAPLFEQGKIWFPRSLFVATKDREGLIDMCETFRSEEYTAFPYSSHDDMLDSLARIADPDLGVIWPRASETRGLRAANRRVDGRAAAWVA